MKSSILNSMTGLSLPIHLATTSFKKSTSFKPNLTIWLLPLPLTSLARCVPDVPSISQFTLPSESDIQKLIEATPKKSCMLDPIPTPLVIGCIDILLPVITKIINISLQTGQFADQWKCALVHPLLKKPGLDLVLKNYRPISNLQYISKLTEKAVFQQLTAGTIVLKQPY